MEWENLASLLSLGVGIAAATVLLAGWIPSRAINAIEISFVKLAKRRWVCLLVLLILSLTVNLLITIHRGLPQPLIHDEFSYLLAADTFAHGRLTNPTPAFAEHFETPQQLMRPTYMSKYPPGQGIALAIGQILTGKPIVGAWLSTAAAVGAIYWMLLGFVPPSWALLGGLVAAIHPQLLDWSQMYWGGSVAVIGGALLLGAWGRLMVAVSPIAAGTLAMGLIILANSRPFEGLVWATVLIVGFFISRVRSGRGSLGVSNGFGDTDGPRPEGRRLLKSGAVFFGIPLLIAAGGMGYYNHRITGRMFQIPYFEYARQYEIYPKFWFLPAGAMRVYHNPAMEYVHRYFERGAYLGFHTLGGAIANSQYRFSLLFTTNISLAVLLLPLAVGLVCKKDRRLVWVMVALGMFALAMWTEIFVFPHYLAPMLPAVLLLVMTGWRAMWRESRGRALARAAAIGFFAGAMMALAQPVYRDRDLLDQKSVVDSFPQLVSGRHLIFVSYGPMHSLHSELVHNLSNLDQGRIIWARSFGKDADGPVAAHYSGRKIWSLHVGGKIELMPWGE